jgi:hypothetical protein
MKAGVSAASHSSDADAHGASQIKAGVKTEIQYWNPSHLSDLIVSIGPAYAIYKDWPRANGINGTFLVKQGIIQNQQKAANFFVRHGFISIHAGAVARRLIEFARTNHS